MFHQFIKQISFCSIKAQDI